MHDRRLFRGRRLDNGEWIQGDFSRRDSRFAPQLNTTYGISDNYGAFTAVDPVTVGQCTGLIATKSYRGKSEADRLVFEGDEFWDGDYETYFSVVWDDSLAAWMAVYREDGMEYLSDTLNDHTEIIGTIHDRTEGRE